MPSAASTSATETRRRSSTIAPVGVALDVGVLVGERDRHLEAGEHVAAVAVGPLDEQGERLLVDAGALGLQPPASEQA